MPFDFTLATLLRFRESVEKQEERALHRIQVEIARTTQQLQATDEALVMARQSWHRALRSPTLAAHLHSVIGEEQSLETMKKTLMRKVDELRVERDQQLIRYRAAHRDHEALLNLRGTQRAAYEQHQARVQQKITDDIFIARAWRK